MEKVSTVHKNLYHYTNWQGLEGILRSQSLWATNIRFLNDRSEYYHAQEPIYRLLLPKICGLLDEKLAKSGEVRKFVEEKGGTENYASKIAKSLVSATYKATGEDFYVLSLCGEHPNPHVRENGLLSQWRGYGSGGGYAIELEAKELEEITGCEFQQFDYATSHLSDAIYGEEDEKFNLEFVPIIEGYIKLADKIIREAIFNEDPATGKEEFAAYNAVHWCTTRYKHIGFREENEVRIVAAPAIHNQHYLDTHKAQGVALKPPKEIKFRTANGRPIPYISLFGFSDMKLPIKKIIVGPGENKNSTAAAIRKLVSNANIEVTVSDIPFV